MKKRYSFLAMILILFLYSEILIALSTVLVVYGIRSFFMPITFATGGIFYGFMVILTGLNMLWMSLFPSHWRTFFTRMLQRLDDVGQYLKIFFSWFVPGVTIPQREIDEANDIGKKSKEK